MFLNLFSASSPLESASPSRSSTSFAHGSPLFLHFRFVFKHMLGAGHLQQCFCVRAASLLCQLHHRFHNRRHPFIVCFATSNGSRSWNSLRPAPSGTRILRCLPELLFAELLFTSLLVTESRFPLPLLFLTAAFFGAFFAFVDADFSSAGSPLPPRFFSTFALGFFVTSTATAPLPASYFQDINFTPSSPHLRRKLYLPPYQLLTLRFRTFRS